jgi:hypothetical protein
MARIEQTRRGQESRLELGSELIEVGTDGLLHRKKQGSKKQVLPFQCEGGNAEDAAAVLFGFHAEAPFGGFEVACVACGTDELDGASRSGSMSAMR